MTKVHVEKVTPGNASYHTASHTWNSLYRSSPAEIFFPTTAQQVQEVVRYARSRALPFRIRSGGHSFDGYSSVEGGIVISLAKMDSIHIAGDLVTLGPGARLGEVYRYLEKYDLALPGGTCAGVGAGGVTLGGGIGLLGRTHGWLAQSVRSIEFVDADGNLFIVDDEHHPDLFWALRGAGGNTFGIIVSLTYQAYHIPQITSGRISWNWDQLIPLAHAVQHVLPELDDRLNLVAAFLPKFTGKVSLIVHSLIPVEETKRALVPLLSLLPKPIASNFTVESYASAVHESIDPETLYSDDIRGTTIMPSITTPFDHEILEKIRDDLENARGETAVYFYGLGAQSASAQRNKSTPVALPHVDAFLILYSRIYWTDPADDEFNFAWMRKLAADVLPACEATYINSHDIHIDDRILPRYGASYPRLSEIKKHYDSDNFFTFEAGISPT